MGSDPPSLGTRIRRARERARLSQEELATAVGASVRAVGDWENDRRKPRNRLGALEEVLSVDLSKEPREPRDWEIAEDDWESAILADANLTSREKKEIILRSRRVRAELYPGIALRRPQPPERGRESEAG